MNDLNESGYTTMKTQQSLQTPAALRRLLDQESLNFILTNRLPRVALTHFMGWLSKIEHPWVCRPAIAIWKMFADLDLSEAARQDFKSLHDCFTRALKPGARPFNPDPTLLCSPSDGIIVGCGPIVDETLIQAKGLTYTLTDLIHDPARVDQHRNGFYVTLRLKSSMYHRFHAPADCRVSQVDYISGDVWNVNPPALKRVPGLYCRNERAVIRAQLADGSPMTLVPVAAILVASIRLHWLDVRLHLRYRGANPIPCDAALARGEEMGWFEHGSTIIICLPPGYGLAEDLGLGAQVQAGQALAQPEKHKKHKL